jgi:hypothetical protein
MAHGVEERMTRQMLKLQEKMLRRVTRKEDRRSKEVGRSRETWSTCLAHKQLSVARDSKEARNGKVFDEAEFISAHCQRCSCMRYTVQLL